MQTLPQDEIGLPQRASNEPIPLDSYCDEILLQEIACGAMWALEVLYQRHHCALYTFAYRMIRDPHMAEDLLQETFLLVWRRALSYTPQLGSGRGWLFSIIHHRAIDYLRAVRRAPLCKFTLDQVESSGYATGPDVWDEVWRALQSSQIRTALLKLSNEQRLVIELAYFQDWTYAQIAACYHLPPGTVKARIRLALRHLRHNLERMDPAEL